MQFKGRTLVLEPHEVSFQVSRVSEATPKPEVRAIITLAGGRKANVPGPIVRAVKDGDGDEVTGYEIRCKKILARREIRAARDLMTMKKKRTVRKKRPTRTVRRGYIGRH